MGQALKGLIQNSEGCEVFTGHDETQNSGYSTDSHVPYCDFMPVTPEVSDVREIQYANNAGSFGIIGIQKPCIANSHTRNFTLMDKSPRIFAPDILTECKS